MAPSTTSTFSMSILTSLDSSSSSLTSGATTGNASWLVFSTLSTLFSNGYYITGAYFSLLIT